MLVYEPGYSGKACLPFIDDTAPYRRYMSMDGFYLDRIRNHVCCYPVKGPYIGIVRDTRFGEIQSTSRPTGLKGVRDFAATEYGQAKREGRDVVITGLKITNHELIEFPLAPGRPCACIHCVK